MTTPAHLRALQITEGLPALLMRHGHEVWFERSLLGGYQVRGPFSDVPAHFDSRDDAESAWLLYVKSGVSPLGRKTLTRLKPIGG